MDVNYNNNNNNNNNNNYYYYYYYFDGMDKRWVRIIFIIGILYLTEICWVSSYFI